MLSCIRRVLTRRALAIVCSVAQALACLCVSQAEANDLPASHVPPLEKRVIDVSAQNLVSAIQRAVPWVERGSSGAADQRACFMCHHQGMALIALAEVRRAGMTIDEANWRRQIEHTRKHLDRGRENYQKGRGQGGKMTTAGYALWSLAAAGVSSDATTDSVANYLLRVQSGQGYWSQASRRPPTSGSHFMNSYVSLRGLRHFGTKEQVAELRSREVRLRRWVQKAPARSTEDHVFRLRLAALLESYEGRSDLIARSRSALVASQRSDGGWAQIGGMASDAYATATAVAALQVSESLDVARADVSSRSATALRTSILKGTAWLLADQHSIGSWHVKTRATGFQSYFESGFPHGEDQFVSMSATCWAIIALCRESRKK